MIRRWWPVALVVLAAACSNGACSGRGFPRCCHVAPAVVRDATYVGSILATDGGVTTQVKLVVTPNGNARLTFVRDGIEVTESFAANERYF